MNDVTAKHLITKLVELAKFTIAAVLVTYLILRTPDQVKALLPLLPHITW